MQKANPTRLKHISEKCPTSVNVNHMSNTCQKHVKHESNKCPTSVQHVYKKSPKSPPTMSNKCPESLSKVPLQFADAYLLYVFLHSIIPELEALSPLFRLSNTSTSGSTHLCNTKLTELPIEELPRATFGNSRIPMQKHLRVTFVALRPAQRHALLCNATQRYSIYPEIKPTTLPKRSLSQ
jgi:hypothetical protein